jgi:hypothetical protein
MAPCVIISEPADQEAKAMRPAFCCVPVGLRAIAWRIRAVEEAEPLPSYAKSPIC